MNPGKIQKNKTAILTLAVALVAAALAAIFLATGPQQTVPTSTPSPAAQISRRDRRLARHGGADFRNRHTNAGGA